MITLNYATLRSNQFREAVSKVAQCRDLDVKVAYNFMRLAQLLEKKIVETQKEWLALAADLAVVNEDGSFKVDEATKELVWKDGVESASAINSFKAFNAKEMVFDRFKFKLEGLHNAKLSPADLASLEPLLEV
jgi:predicted RNase H-like nuclease